MVKNTFRYAAFEPCGKIKRCGQTYASVAVMGPVIIVDYQKKRHTIVHQYPVAHPIWNVEPWRVQQKKISEIFHKGTL